MAENHTKTMCQLSNDLSTTGNIEEGNSSQDFKVADAAEALCRTILRYEKCIRCGKSIKLTYLKKKYAFLLIRFTQCLYSRGQYNMTFKFEFKSFCQF